jgi:hypothetical protein
VAAQRAGDIFRDIQHARGQADSSLEIGVISQLGGDLDAAEEHLRRALNLFREARARRDEALTLAALGRCAIAAPGRTSEGAACLRKAEDISRSIGAAGNAG